MSLYLCDRHLHIINGPHKITKVLIVLLYVYVQSNVFIIYLHIETEIKTAVIFSVRDSMDEAE
jgi:hypothetical protein